MPNCRNVPLSCLASSICFVCGQAFVALAVGRRGKTPNSRLVDNFALGGMQEAEYVLFSPSNRENDLENRLLYSGPENLRVQLMPL
ncbi:unnamed protein product [Protopolystoma xenopodis]|uniref:Uncharacterized protein n=1 Tax=Protopolystoma xenopodis TaxID=117903 RepID=A0A3S5BFK3_9PLAT|nr:unnamed protein product [Protopolystoma xenopodis]